MIGVLIDTAMIFAFGFFSYRLGKLNAEIEQLGREGDAAQAEYDRLLRAAIYATEGDR